MEVFKNENDVRIEEEEEVKGSIYQASIVPKKEFKPIEVGSGEVFKSEKVSIKNTGTEAWPEAVCLYQISPSNESIIQGNEDKYLKIQSAIVDAFKEINIPIVAPKIPG